MRMQLGRCRETRGPLNLKISQFFQPFGRLPGNIASKEVIKVNHKKVKVINEL